MDDKECRIRASQGENEMFDEDEMLDGEWVDTWDICDDDDGQPTMYEELQDLYGGDDWDHGQFDGGEW